MDDIATGVVNDTPMIEEASTPETKGSNSVGEDKPKRDKSHPCLDVHAPKNRASQQNKSDGCKSELEVDKRGHGVKGLNHWGLHRSIVT